MARKYDTMGSTQGKKRLQRRLPHYVTQFMEAIDLANKEARWDDYFKAIDIYLSRTMPKLSSIDHTMDNSGTIKLLEEMKKWNDSRATETRITTVEAKLLPESTQDTP